MQTTVIVTWIVTVGETDNAQQRINQLNAEGYEMRFLTQSSAQHYAYCTAIMVRETKDEVS